MRVLLICIIVVSYFIALMDLTLSSHYTGVGFICGTTALAAAGIIHQLVGIKERLPEPIPAGTTSPAASSQN